MKTLAEKWTIFQDKNGGLTVECNASSAQTAAIFLFTMHRAGLIKKEMGRLTLKSNDVNMSQLENVFERLCCKHGLPEKSFERIFPARIQSDGIIPSSDDIMWKEVRKVGMN